MSDLTAQGIQVTNPKQLARLQPRDEYETEIHLISSLFAYFEIASMRVIEVMPMYSKLSTFKDSRKDFVGD